MPGEETLYYAFCRGSSWGKYKYSQNSHYKSTDTSYWDCGVGLGYAGACNLEVGVLRISNDELKDTFYYISFSFDFGGLFLLPLIY